MSLSLSQGPRVIFFFLYTSGCVQCSSRTSKTGRHVCTLSNLFETKKIIRAKCIGFTGTRERCFESSKRLF